MTSTEETKTTVFNVTNGQTEEYADSSIPAYNNLLWLDTDADGRYDTQVIGDGSTTFAQLPRTTRTHYPTADGEDLTITDEGVLQFASRPFAATSDPEVDGTSDISAIKVIKSPNYGYKRLRKGEVENAGYEIDKDATQTTTSSTEEYKSHTSIAMSDACTIYEVVHTHDLGGHVVRMPDDCILYFNGGTFYNGTILSNKTKVINLPKATSTAYQSGSTAEKYENTPHEIDIIGKIYNIYGREITVRGDVINRHTPLYYNYNLRETGTRYDKNGTNNAMRIARNTGLTDCIISVYVRNDYDKLEETELNQCVCNGNGCCSTCPFKSETTTCNLPFCPNDENIFNSKYFVSGTWENRNYRNKPTDIAKEIYLNGLSVKAFKFHINPATWREGGTLDERRKSVQEYCAFVYAYIRALSNKLDEFGIDNFDEVYIVNERADWTSNGSDVVDIIVNLAKAIRALGKTPRCSFAGEYQMAEAAPELCEVIEPAFNSYPTLSFKDGRTTPSDDKVTLLAEKYRSIGTLWKGRCDMQNIPLSEIGVRPNLKALRSPEHWGNNADVFYENSMVTFWTAFKEFARNMHFAYVCVWYWDEIYNNSGTDVPNSLKEFRREANIEDKMYNLFITM